MNLSYCYYMQHKRKQYVCPKVIHTYKTLQSYFGQKVPTLSSKPSCHVVGCAQQSTFYLITHLTGEITNKKGH